MRKHPGVYEYRPGEWWVEVYDGRKRKRWKAGSYAAAVALHGAKRQEIREQRLGLIPPKPRRIPTVAEAIHDTLVRSAHLPSYREYARAGHLFTLVFGDLKLDAVTPGDIDRWRATYAQGHATATVNRQLAFLRKVYNDAKTAKLILESPFERIQVNDLYNREAMLRSKYKITGAQYDKMLTAQGNCCAICKIAKGKKHFNVDHCHATGRVRGLLCHSCNTSLGKFKDSAEILRVAAQYVESCGASVLERKGV